jgi:RIO kinase 1
MKHEFSIMKKQTKLELRKISEGVFDNAALTTLNELARKGVLDEVKSKVCTGKEANVFHGFRGNEEIAIKIYLVEASDFKNMSKYLRGDRRFGGWKNRRQLIYNWAKKEFRNLSRLYGEIRCPKPIGFLNNVLVMEFIGKNGVAAPRLKDSPPDDPKGYYALVRQYMRNMYECEIVHGDLSEYNILNDGEPVIIDISMGVLLDHPLADEMLERDIHNILAYFHTFGIEEKEDELLKFIKFG